ncbi:MAG: YbjQ family protein, partial [Lachnospiraceae bacterium]|nr:YbjQ family protein [Lachnospiraceae bacterium]
MVVVTTETITGKNLEMLTMVKGATVHTVHMGKDLLAGFKTMVGGELKSYTEMMDNARAIATQRMIAEAEKFGADAIVGVRFASSAITQQAA